MALVIYPKRGWLRHMDLTDKNWWLRRNQGIRGAPTAENPRRDKLTSIAGCWSSAALGCLLVRCVGASATKLNQPSGPKPCDSCAAALGRPGFPFLDDYTLRYLSRNAMVAQESQVMEVKLVTM